ncbi:MAG: peroxiredoxin-like family protein [bacterium]|jgi:peroxiredoxin
MPRLTAGQMMPDFQFQTPFRPGLRFRPAAGGKKTVLLFLRYYGCTLCQLDIRRLAQNYDKIEAAGGQVFVVLQSEPETIAGQMAENDLPFMLICDPAQTLYKEFAIPVAASVEEMLGGKTKAKIAELEGTGLKHGKYEGEEQQLPAVFVVDTDGRITYVHYAKDLADIPNVDEMAELLK